VDTVLMVVCGKQSN